MRATTQRFHAFLIAMAVTGYFLGCSATGPKNDDEDASSSDDDSDQPADTGSERVAPAGEPTGDADTDVDTAADADVDSDSDADADGDGDVDSDGDSDSDADSDADGDADSDGDSDSDGDTELGEATDSNSGGDTETDTFTDTDTDAGGETETGSETDTAASCDCAWYQVCDPQTGSCHCPEGYTGSECALCDTAVGYLEWPAGSGTCMLDPCLGVTCGGRGTCSLGDNGLAVCDCEGEGTGIGCNQHWQTIQVPPFVSDMAFDSNGNGWFLTKRGLLYWDFNGTPEETSDDGWQLFLGVPFEPRGFAVDAMDKKWVSAEVTVTILDDHQTPFDLSDDTQSSFSAPDTFISSYVERFIIDRVNRVWVFILNRNGVNVLEDASLIDQSEPPWTPLFEDLNLTDVAGDLDGVWLVTESGVYYVALGDLYDTGDDQRADFSEVPALADHQVDSVFIDEEGNKYFNTEAGIVRLDDGGDPFDDNGHAWSTWSPTRDGEPVDIGPIIGIDGDNAKWLKTPMGSIVRVTDPQTGDPIWTEYAPQECPLFEDLDNGGEIDTIAIDDTGRKLVSTGRDLYYFDDRGTPTDLSDDEWIVARREETDNFVWKILPDPGSDGGLWILVHIPARFGCVRRIYYFHPGDSTNPYDDVWEYYPMDWTGSCVDIIGLDGQERPWIQNSSGAGDSPGPFFILDDGGTPFSQSDDTWVSYSNEETDLTPHGAGFDSPRSVWFGGRHFDMGDSLMDTNDDQWLTIASFEPRSVAVDLSGNRWFALDGAIRYFFDAGTLAHVDDDVWIEFSTADGLPFSNIKNIRVDGFDEKWIVNRSWDGEPQLCSLDDNGTPEDKTDDTWTNYTTNEGLAGTSVNDIVIDDHSDVWIATNHGISYLHVER